MKKEWYRNWTMHNLISHPISEIVYLSLLLIDKEKAIALLREIHDITLPYYDR